jgi:[ribosomal protein S5]-alanine N-acetyltransferase
MTERSKDRIETPQLTLLRATLPLLRAEEAYVEAEQKWSDVRLPSECDLSQNVVFQEWRTSSKRFRELLGAGIGQRSWDNVLQAIKGEAWPELDAFDSRDLAKLYLSSNPESRWGMWYILFKRPLSNYQPALLIGTSGFKSPPSSEGTVEIGYWILDRYQAIQLAAEAVGALVGHAFEDPRVQRVIARASARHIPTIRVLGKNGFLRTGARGGADGSLLFQRDREAAI